MNYDRNSWLAKEGGFSEIVIYPETKEQADAMEEYILSGQFKRDFERWREITEKQ